MHPIVKSKTRKISKTSEVSKTHKKGKVSETRRCMVFSVLATLREIRLVR